MSYLPNIEKYRIIFSENASKDIVKSVETLKSAIKEFTDAELATSADTLDDRSAYSEILVGKTNRCASKDALTILEKEECDNTFIISSVGNKIAILGKDDTATMHALKFFIENYISSKVAADEIQGDFTKTEKYDTDTTILPALVTVKVPLISTIESEPKKWPTYGRIVELMHNGENNGLLFATSQWSGRCFPVYKSADGGKTWELISTAEEQLDENLKGNWQPHIYELPCRVGEMPVGTLLLSGCSHNEENDVSKMCIWRSYDLGKTWEEYSVVDVGGNPKNGGVWEPFLICDEDGSLVCFYSDEMEVTDVHGQRLVLRVSSDGENWGEEKYCAMPEERALRPGMVSVAKMGNYGYLIVYEMIGQKRGPVYYKISKSLTEWEDAVSLGTRLTTEDGDFTGCTPYCEWTPLGGKYGTVIAAGRFGSEDIGKSSDLFLSFDLGKTWSTIKSPLEFDYMQRSGANYAYSFGFFTASDGSVYYINNVFPDDEEMKYKCSALKLAKITLDGYASYESNKD
ncbi:MAG: exo-alpha-sialidase [Ruminococcaceae bacterium]|nr:exo-alpha-sialidase [Oscillospiraceae bacterium]